MPANLYIRLPKQFSIIALFLTVLILQISTTVNGQTSVTVEEIGNSIVESRNSIERLLVDCYAQRVPDKSLKGSSVVQHLGRDERHKFAFAGSMRYSDYLGNSFGEKSSVDKFVAVYNGKQMFRREGKFVTISSQKSSSVDMNTYLNVLLWPISNPDFDLCKEPPETVPFLPRMLDSSWKISLHSMVIRDDECIELVEADGGRKLYLASMKNLAPVRYVFSSEKTGKGFGKFTCDFIDFKQYAGCFLPSRITTQLEINKLKSDEIAGVMTNQIQVKELRVNEDVPVSLFEFAPSPGDTVVDNDAGTIGTFSPKSSVNVLENSLAEAKSAFTRSNRFTLLSGVQRRWGAIAFIAGLLCFPVFRILVKGRAHYLLLAFLPALLLSSKAMGQDTGRTIDVPTDFSAYVRSDSHQVLFVEMTGDLNVQSRPFRRYLTPLPFVNILLNDNVATELEILDYQLNDLKKVAERLRKAIEDSEEILDQAAFIDEKHKHEVHQLLDEPAKAGFKVVDEILVAHQAEHLRKIFTSFQIRRVGLCAALINEPLCTELEISPAQKAKLELIFKDKIEAALEELGELKKKALDDLLAKLTRKQREQLQNLFGDDTFLEKTPFSVFVRQLDPTFLKKSIELEADNPWPEYLPLVFTCEFRIGFDSKPQFSDSLVANRNATIDISDQLLEMLQQPAIQERFNLVAFQQQKLQEFSAQKRKFFQQKQEALNAHAQEHGWTSLDEFQEVWTGKRMELATQIKERIDATLLPFQLEQIRKFATVVGAQRIGIVYSLSSSNLGDDIGITDAQKETVAKTASRLFANLIEDAKKIEKKINDELLQTLSPEQKRKLKTLTSEFVDLETGQLDLHNLLQQPIFMQDVIVEQQRMVQFLNWRKETEK